MADEIAATDYNSSGMYDNETQMIYTGPKFGPTGQALMVTLYSLIAFLAFTGNMIVIFVELYGKRSARNLQKFLINLAISDLVNNLLLGLYYLLI